MFLRLLLGASPGLALRVGSSWRLACSPLSLPGSSLLAPSWFIALSSSFRKSS